MFEKLKLFLKKENENFQTNNNSHSENRILRMEIAATALMVEMAKADGDFTREEHENIAGSLQQVFTISKERAEELINISEEELKESVSLYEFSGVLNETFTREEKIELLDHLWKLIYTDKKLDKYEDKLVKQIGGMLQLDHKDVIHSKLFVKQQMEESGNQGNVLPVD